MDDFTGIRSTGVGIIAGIGVAEAGAAAFTTGVALEESSPEIAQTVNTGTNVVYQSVVNGVTKYVGITNDLDRRIGEHMQIGRFIEGIPGLDKLSRFDAKAVEQVLINSFGLENLENQINSIATLNPIYRQAIERGKDILQQIAK